MTLNVGAAGVYPFLMASPAVAVTKSPSLFTYAPGRVILKATPRAAPEAEAIRFLIVSAFIPHSFEAAAKAGSSCPPGNFAASGGAPTWAAMMGSTLPNGEGLGLLAALASIAARFLSAVSAV